MASEQELHWRETYFIFFDGEDRLTLTQAERALGELDERYELRNLTANDDGLLESVALYSAEDNAALEISYEAGDAVIEQTAELAKELKADIDTDQLATLVRADARFDVMHFEVLHASSMADEDDDGMEEMLDPSCLLLVVETLVKLTNGIPIDPASGAVLP